MKPREPTIEKTEEHYKKVLEWVIKNPQRATYALIRIESVYDDYLKEIMKR